jgi:hypothetical protein
MAAVTISANPFMEDRARNFLHVTAGVTVLINTGQPPYPKQGAEWDVRPSTRAAVPITDWVSEYSSEPEAVRRFCGDRRLMRQAQVAVQLAEQQFPKRGKVRLRVEQDPESDAESLVVHVPVPRGTRDVLDPYNGFVDQWVAIAPPDAVGLISLTFKFI